MTACTTTPFLHQNKPPRESIFCDKVSGWWTGRALIMLNSLLKTRQKTIVPHIHMWVMPQKECTLTTSSASSCRAGHARPTKSASCKGRGMQPSTADFQLVENTRNDFNQSPLLMHNHVLPHTNGAAISQQRLELENHLLSAINAQRCHALKPNKHTNSL